MYGDGSCTESFEYRQDGTPLALLYTNPAGATARYWYLVDGRGDVLGLADDALAGTPDLYSYDAWGLPVGTQTENLPQPLRYRGYVWDRDLGLYWLGARQYDPQVERHPQAGTRQPDPSEQEGVRSYVYAGDDPVDRSDPSGLDACAPEEEDGAGCGGDPNLVKTQMGPGGYTRTAP